MSNPYTNWSRTEIGVTLLIVALTVMFVMAGGR
jgi:hypothetical protein